MKIIFDEESLREFDIDEKLFDYMKKAGDICIAGEGLDPQMCEVSSRAGRDKVCKRAVPRHRQRD